MRHVKTPWWKKRITKQEVMAALDLYSIPEYGIIELKNEEGKEEGKCLRTLTQKHGMPKP